MILIWAIIQHSSFLSIKVKKRDTVYSPTRRSPASLVKHTKMKMSSIGTVFKVFAVLVGVINSTTAATLANSSLSNLTTDAITTPIEDSLELVGNFSSSSLTAEAVAIHEEENQKANNAKNCGSIQGVWKNQLGSEMTVMENDGVLVGEYRTAVESRPGAAGGKFSILRGVGKAFENGNAVGFAVVYNRGRSLAVWIGECSKCGDNDVLRTTWLLRSQLESLGDEWKSTRTNEDIFFRKDTLEEIRKPLTINVTNRPTKTGNETVSKETIDVVYNESMGNNDFSGTWYSKDGVHMLISRDKSIGTIEGVYSRAGEVYPIFGSFAPGEANGTLGLYAMMDSKESVLVGVGQYYTNGGNEVIETSWLHRKVGDENDAEVNPVSIARRTFKRASESNTC